MKRNLAATMRLRYNGRVHARLIFIALLLLSGNLLRAAPPNILLIYTDDQGYGDVSALNPEAKFSTPTLDRLANEGLAFTNAHSPDTVCTPSRYGMLTGRYCWRTRRKTGVMGAEGTGLIPDDRVTLASHLQQAGYQTAMVGKWHLGMDFPGTSPQDRDWRQPVRDMPLDKGFGYFFGIPASLNYGVLAWFRGRHAAVPPTVFTAKKPNHRHVDYRIQPPYQQSPTATKQTLGKPGMEVAPDFIDNQCLTRFTNEAITSIRERDPNQPFFLYLPYTSPHYPVCPLPPFWGKGACGGYGEFMIETDHHVGRLLGFLEKEGLDENTLIVFTSDNGPENSWKERVEKFGHRSNGPFRGGKRSIYEGGHRVPFLLRWPAGIQEPGRRWHGLVGQTDLLATVAELIGLPLPPGAGEDSVSFADILTQPNATPNRPPLINHGANGRFAITQGPWKLIFPHRGRPRELYHLENDPGETTNLVAEHADRARELEAKATAIVSRGNDTGHWEDLTWITAAQYERAQKEE